MTSKHLVADDLLPLLDAMPTLRLNAATLPKIRAAREAMTERAGPVRGVRAEERWLPAADGRPELPMLLYIPQAEAAGKRPAILHIHGGGYVLGSPDMADLPNKLLCRSLGAVIASIGYRLAPEVPHPGPVEDCYAGLTWLYEQADTLGIDTSRIAIKGESAGGGLAAGLALLARDRGEFAICHQHLTYPMTDDRTCTRDTPPYAGEFVWTPENNHFGWASLLGTEPGSDEVSVYAAASRAEDLSGLPPAYIATAALDLFLEENLDYARRLTRAGVPVEMHVYPGAFHGFQGAPEAQASKAYARDSLDALRAALN